MDDNLSTALGWVGLFVSFLGLVTTVPGATRHGVQRAAKAAGGLAAKVTRVLHLRSRPATKTAIVGGAASLSGGGSMRATARAWIPSESQDQKVERLRAWLLEVESALGNLRSELLGELDRRDARIGEVDGRLTGRVEAIRRDLRDMEVSQRRFDGRGLALTAAGIVLSNMPLAVVSIVPFAAWLVISFVAVSGALLITLDSLMLAGGGDVADSANG